MSAEEIIRSRPCPDCYVCGARGEPLYQGLRDRLFGAPGDWDLKRCPDSECGLVWLDPMPVEEDIGKAYATYYTHQVSSNDATPPRDNLFARIRRGYLANKFGYSFTEGASLDRVLAWTAWFLPGHSQQWSTEVFHLPAIADGRLLEIGCGNGATLARLRALGWHVEGIEVDEAAVQAARQRDLTVHLGVVHEQKYADNSFDAVVMSHVIEHVPTPRALLQECLRITKPGGRLVSITPNVSSWGHRHFGQFWRGLEPPRHLNVFTPLALYKLAVQSGWSFLHVYSSAASAHGILLASYRAQKGLPREAHDNLSTGLRLCARLIQLFEAIAVAVSPSVGEELVLIARKQTNLSVDQDLQSGRNPINQPAPIREATS